jgi:hypothetical protein
LYSQLPAGTLNVPCQTPSLASKARWLAAQAGCQSSEQPISLCRLPAMVTADGWGLGPPPAVTVRTCVAGSYRKSVSTQSLATVKGMFAPPGAPAAP